MGEISGLTNAAEVGWAVSDRAGMVAIGFPAQVGGIYKLAAAGVGGVLSKARSTRLQAAPNEISRNIKKYRIFIEQYPPIDAQTT